MHEMREEEIRKDTITVSRGILMIDLRQPAK
jgi:hypothetical protein